MQQNQVTYQRLNVTLTEDDIMGETYGVQETLNQECSLLCGQLSKPALNVGADESRYNKVRDQHVMFRDGILHKQYLLL